MSQAFDPAGRNLGRGLALTSGIAMKGDLLAEYRFTSDQMYNRDFFDIRTQLNWIRSGDTSVYAILFENEQVGDLYDIVWQCDKTPEELRIHRNIILPPKIAMVNDPRQIHYQGGGKFFFFGD